MYSIYNNNKENSDIFAPKPCIEDINTTNIEKFLSEHADKKEEQPKEEISQDNINAKQKHENMHFNIDNQKTVSTYDSLLDTNPDFNNCISTKQYFDTRSNPTNIVNQNIEKKDDNNSQIVSKIIEPIILNSSTESKSNNTYHRKDNFSNRNDNIHNNNISYSHSNLKILPPSMLDSNDEETSDILNHLEKTEQDLQGKDLVNDFDYNSKSKKVPFEIQDNKKQESIHDIYPNLNKEQISVINSFKVNNSSILNNTDDQNEFVNFKRNIVNEEYFSDTTNEIVDNDDFHLNLDSIPAKNNESIDMAKIRISENDFILPSQVLSNSEIIYFFSPSLFKYIESDNNLGPEEYKLNSLSIKNHKNLANVEEMSKKLQFILGKFILPILKLFCIITVISKTFIKNIHTLYEQILVLKYKLTASRNKNQNKIKYPDSISVLDVMQTKEDNLSAVIPISSYSSFFNSFFVSIFMNYLYWFIVTFVIFLCGTLISVLLKQFIA